MKKGTLIFPEFGYVHLGKDVYMMPKYLQDLYQMEVIYFGEELFSKEVTFKRLGKEKNIFLIKEYLKTNALKSDFIIVFHLTRETYTIIKEYIRYNKNGKVILKLDMSKGDTDEINKKRYKINRLKKNFMIKYILNNSSIICVETDFNYNDIITKKILGIDVSKKLICLKNGFDERSLNLEKIKISPFEEKENKIIFVGRISDPKKNINMFLEAIRNIDLKSWTVELIGPYDDYIENYIKEKKINVKLTGNISNKEELYQKYNEAKVFVLTSNEEGFPIVYSEALRFGNYILTTDVGGAEDITNDGKIGKIIPKNEVSKLQNELELIISGKIDLDKKYNESIEYCLKEFIWQKNIKKVVEKIEEISDI